MGQEPSELRPGLLWGSEPEVRVSHPAAVVGQAV